jgi:hypothetical protein
VYLYVYTSRELPLLLYICILYYLKLRNAVLLAKYYGNGDGPQHDFFLMDGLVKENNDLLLLCYDGRSGGNEGVSIEVREWRMSDWSGNVDEEGHPYVMRRQSIVL